MNIMFGNLSVSEIEARLGVKFPQHIADFMNDNHQASAQNVLPGKWHCFDIPFNIVCGDVETAKKIYGALKGKSGECKESLRISVNGYGV